MDDINITFKLILKIMGHAVWAVALIAGSLSLLVLSLDERCNCSTPKQEPPLFGQATTIYKDKPDTRPTCLTWYTVPENETQWLIASKFSKGKDYAKWLESMRYMSHKAPNDENVRKNESVCVEW